MATSNILAGATDQVSSIIKSIASNICQHPEDVQIVSTSMATATIHTVIICHQEDKKRIIGKEGRTIKSMRTILHSAVAKDGLKTSVVVDE